jgi:hypothetical protein
MAKFGDNRFFNGSMLDLLAEGCPPVLSLNQLLRDQSGDRPRRNPHPAGPVGAERVRSGAASAAITVLTAEAPDSAGSRTNRLPNRLSEIPLAE